MNKKKLIAIGIATILLIIVYSFYNKSTDENVSLTTKVIKGDFINEVIISGEAQSTSSKKINAPTEGMRFGIYNLKIENLIPEGTIVKKGDYIAKLDVSEVNQKILDAQLNLESSQSKYTEQQLDTTLKLKLERTKIKDLLYNIEEAKLELKQSIYETPSSIRQLEIKIERNERDLKELNENYSIKKRQAYAKMIQVGTGVSKNKQRINDLNNLLKKFTIHSDGDGMLTYITSYNGKISAGSTVYSYRPAIASLPDLSKMESKTFSNEVDIRKIKKDLKVIVGFDAFPDIELEGIITSVANIGESKRGSDIKLFQVLIKLNETNKNIKPGMTTSNRIMTHKEENVLMAPLEAIFSKDSISYVYTKNGFSIGKKQVELGLSNNTDIIIKKGLKEGETIYLNKPENSDDKSITLLQ